MKVLLTGASGFIGLPLLQNLVEQGHQILAITRAPVKYLKSVDFIQADLSSPVTYYKRVESFEPEVVIHLAWQGIPDFSYENSKNNLNYSLDFFSFIIRLGCCKKIIVSGSCFEFNKLNGECLESENSTSKDNFTWAKHSIRAWLEIQCSAAEIQLGWLRIFYVYGPRQRSNSLIPTILNSLEKGNFPEIRTPKNSNDFIYIEDVVNAFSNAVLLNYPSGIYNLGSGSSTSIIEVCRIAEKIISRNDFLTQRLQNKTVSSLESSNFWANVSKTKKHLNWHSVTDLEKGISSTWQSLKK